MKIHLQNDWWLRSDVNSFMLSRKCPDRLDKDGVMREVWKDETYHANVEQALKRMCRNEIITCHATTLEGLQREFKRLQKIMAEISERLGEEGITK